MHIKKFTFYIFGLLLLSACSRPVARFTASESEMLIAPATVQFENNSEEAESYYWEFGDGGTSIEANPSHEYLQSGNYEVRLTAYKGKNSREMTQTIQVAPPDKCLVYLKTEKGNLVIELYDDTPQHRDNFLKLVDEGFYDGLLFHRVIKGFMIQGGDPNSKNIEGGTRLGTGGPGYTIPAEITKKHYHVKGALAAARTPDTVNPEKNSSGSQFYIVHGKEVSAQILEVLQAQKNIQYSEEQKQQYLNLGGYPFLDNEYTVFGQVIRGLDIIDQLADVETNGQDRPTNDLSMEMISIK